MKKKPSTNTINLYIEDQKIINLIESFEKPMSSNDFVSMLKLVHRNTFDFQKHLALGNVSPKKAFFFLNKT